MASSGFRGMPQAETHSAVWLASSPELSSPLSSPLLTVAKVTLRSWAPAGSTRNAQQADGGRGRSAFKRAMHDTGQSAEPVTNTTCWCSDTKAGNLEALG